MNYRITIDDTVHGTIAAHSAQQAARHASRYMRGWYGLTIKNCHIIKNRGAIMIAGTRRVRLERV